MLPLAPLILICFGSTGFAKLYENAADLPGLNYDFVVVGGGTAGNVVANRLTENPKYSVLLLEAGGSHEGLLESEIPFFLINMLSDQAYHWNYTTTPQAGLNNRILDYSQARILGGCSSHNGMAYTRGTAEDFNRYATLTGDESWSWNHIFPYFLKNEKWSPPADLHDTQGQFDPAVHSTQGMTSVSLNGFSWSTFERNMMETSKQLPHALPFNLDMNSGKHLGLGWGQSTIGGGKRSSSATSYLAPKYLQRKNLHVLLHAQVSKLTNPRNTGKLTFGGVQFMQGGYLFTAKATKEIILSAGSVGTPRILLNSGVGDRTILKAAGVATILDLPSVGKNLSDHAFFSASWSVNSTETVESVIQNATRFNEAFAEWNASHTGPFVEFGTTHIAWLRLADDSPIFDNHTDPSPGPESAHIELLFSPRSTTGAVGNFISVTMSPVSSLGRGSIGINSSNPFAPPIIDSGLLTSDFDLFTLREAIKRSYELLSAPVWQDFIIGPTEDLLNLTTEDLNQYIRNSVGSTYHLVGSASMSARDAGYGVVDPDLLVKGVSGLRIIDASVLPRTPTAHTQAATYVAAEKGADLVKQHWL